MTVLFMLQNIIAFRKRLSSFFKNIQSARILLLIPFLAVVRLSGQEPVALSGVYNQVSLQEVILDLEKKSSYSFFFLKDWVAQDSVTVTVNSEAIVSVLDKILEGTTLNYHLIENEKRIIILQNTIVYDELPLYFFGRDSANVNAQTTRGIRNAPPPTFFNEDVRQTRKEYVVSKVGKADVTMLNSTYLLNGKAINARTGEVIEDLSIRVKGTNMLSVTNAQGAFELELPAGYNVLSIRAMGISSTEREVIMYNDGSLNLVLEEGLQQLDEVVVVADAAKNVEGAITGSEQIDSEESKNIPLVLGERDILQVAKTLPGISSAGEGATGLNVRGGKTDQNLVLLDDTVIYNPQHFFGIFQALNPFTTKGVDIYKGAVPVEFGGRLSSVFDIRTKNGNVEEISGEGSIGPVTANLALEIPLQKEKSSLVVGARGAYADWILRSLDDESLNNSEASFFDGILKYHNRVDDNNEVKATAYYSRDAFSITSDSLYNYNNRLFSVRWDHRYNEKTKGALVLDNSRYGFGIDFDGEANIDFDLDYSITETGVKYKLRTSLNDNHTLDYGVTAKVYSVNPGSIVPTGSDSNVSPVFIDAEQALEGALFIGDEINIGEKFLVNLGLRYAFFAALGSGTQRTYQDGLPKNESTVLDTISYGSGEVVKTYGGPEARISARY
ncbi:MAG: hypothetical protein ACI9SG_002164, partial [Maribacter sp.]